MYSFKIQFQLRKMWQFQIRKSVYFKYENLIIFKMRNVSFSNTKNILFSNTKCTILKKKKHFAFKYAAKKNKLRLQNFAVFKYKKCTIVFKVSRFQIWADKATWEISTFEMLVFKISSVEGEGNLRRSFLCGFTK